MKRAGGRRWLVDTETTTADPGRRKRSESPRRSWLPNRLLRSPALVQNDRARIGSELELRIDHLQEEHRLGLREDRQLALPGELRRQLITIERDGQGHCRRE